MFKVIDLVTGEDFTEPESGKVKEFENGTFAGEFARLQTERTGHKCQPRKLTKDKDWQAREAKRFEDGTYTKLPWASQGWWLNDALANIETRNHFAHVSVNKSGMVAFTENAAGGEQNKKVMLNPGRYLTRFYSHILTQDRVRELVELFAARSLRVDGIQFAVTEDDIQEIYEYGPGSCMSNERYREERSWGEFRSPFHPCRVYAAGDLQVAYLRDSRGRITARSLVWPSKKTHSRVYGDVGKLSELLYQAGYKARPPLGAKIQRHMVKNEFTRDYIGSGSFPVLPYIDRGHTSGGGALNATVIDGDEKHLKICDQDEGKWTANQLSGLGHPFVEPPRFECNHCERDFRCDRMRSYDVKTGSREELWCRDCVGRDAFECCGYGRYFDKTTTKSVRLIDGYLWSQQYFDRYGFICDGSKQPAQKDRAIKMKNGQRWSYEWYCSNGFCCDVSGEYLPLTERVYVLINRYKNAVSKEWAKANGYDPETGKKLRGKKGKKDEVEEAEEEQLLRPFTSQIEWRPVAGNHYQILNTTTSTDMDSYLRQQAEAHRILNQVRTRR